MHYLHRCCRRKILNLETDLSIRWYEIGLNRWLRTRPQGREASWHSHTHTPYYPLALSLFFNFNPSSSPLSLFLTLIPHHEDFLISIMATVDGVELSLCPRTGRWYIITKLSPPASLATFYFVCSLCNGTLPLKRDCSVAASVFGLGWQTTTGWCF